jgi:hypothetical protein
MWEIYISVVHAWAAVGVFWTGVEIWRAFQRRRTARKWRRFLEPQYQWIGGESFVRTEEPDEIA